MTPLDTSSEATTTSTSLPASTMNTLDTASDTVTDSTSSVSSIRINTVDELIVLSTGVATEAATTELSAEITDMSAESNATGEVFHERRSGWMLGLVLTLTGLLALGGALIVATILATTDTVRDVLLMKNSVDRAAILAQTPPDALLQSRVQTRQSRAIRLPPLATRPSQLPSAFTGPFGFRGIAMHSLLSPFNGSRPGMPLRRNLNRLNPMG